MKLSIVVITMNRANQLKDALQSCVNSKLPEDTEFVIVDNASSDNTREIVKNFLKKIVIHISMSMRRKTLVSVVVGIGHSVWQKESSRISSMMMR